MAKYFNNIKKTGRVGGSVFAIRGGVTIERAYNPQVLNPKSESQVEARAKLKLISQLAAVAAPVIAMPRAGLMSSRNLFVKHNYGLMQYEDNKATIALTSVQLTKGVVALPAIGAQRTAEDITVYIASSASVGELDVDRVVYAMFQRLPDNKLRFVASRVATEMGETSAYMVGFPLIPGDVFVLAYGVRDNTTNARVEFGNLTMMTGETIAHLIANRVLLETDVTLTETRGVEVPTT